MVNNVTLIGRTGKDPVIKHFDNGGSIAEFSLATTEKWKNKQDEWQEETQWHLVKVNNKFAVERVEKSLKKGMQVYIEGKIKYRKYEKDGAQHFITEISADKFYILEKKEDTTAATPPADDDLPF